MLKEGFYKGHEVHIVAETTALAGVGGTVVAAKGATKGIDKYGGALLAQIPVVTVGSIVTTAYLGGIVTFLVELFEQINIRLGFFGVGIDNHQPLIAATEKVYIHQEFDFVHFDEWHVGEIAAADKAGFFSSKEEKDVCVVSSLLVGHARQVHDGRSAAGIVVGTIENGVAMHSKMLIVSCEDNHRVYLAGNVATDVLRAVSRFDDRRPRGSVRETKILEIVLCQWLDTVSNHLVAKIIGRDGVSPILHPPPEHLRRAEVSYHPPHIGAVLSGG